MSYVIRNYGASRKFPFKDQFITLEKDAAIETNDMEVVQALSGRPQIHVATQPGTAAPVVLPPEASEAEPESEPNDGDEDNNEKDNEGDTDHGNDEDNNEDEGEDSESDDDNEPDYEAMKKRDLLSLAKERNLDVPDTILKTELIELLKD